MIDVKEVSVFSQLTSDEKVPPPPSESIFKSPPIKQKFFRVRKAKSVFDENQYTYDEGDLNQFDGPVDEMFDPVVPKQICPAIPIMAPPPLESGPNRFPGELACRSPRVLDPPSESDQRISAKHEKDTDSHSVLEKISDFFKSKPVNDKVQTTTFVDDIAIQPPSPRQRQSLRYHNLGEPFPDASPFAGTLFIRQPSGESKSATTANHQSSAEHHYGNKKLEIKQYVVKSPWNMWY